MCLLALFFRAVPGVPLIIGANREEAYERPGTPPQRLDGHIPAIGGLDPRAGGTWLGVNAAGVVIAVTNRYKAKTPAKPRSRGLLVRDLLTSHTTAAAAAEVGTKELDQGSYEGCNIVCADEDAIYVLQAGDWLRVRPLPCGVHLLANRDVDDESDPRLAYALAWLGAQQYAKADDAVQTLRHLCAQTGSDGFPPMCLRGDQRGTVSSSVLVVRRPVKNGMYLHAQGPPDQTAYTDCSQLLVQLEA